MIYFKDYIQKIKKHNCFTNNYGFLISTIDQNDTYSVRLLNFSNEEDCKLPIKELYQKYYHAFQLNNKQDFIVEYFIVDEKGKDLSEISNESKSQLINLRNQNIVRIKDMKNINEGKNKVKNEQTK